MAGSRGRVYTPRKCPKLGVGSWIWKDEDRSQRAGCPLGWEQKDFLVSPDKGDFVGGDARGGV